MPHRSDPSGDAGAPLTIVILPGASLLDIRPLPNGMALVRCPGCGATAVFTARSVGAVSHVTFVHEDDECPILARIEAALAGLRASRAAETN